MKTRVGVVAFLLVFFVVTSAVSDGRNEVSQSILGDWQGQLDAADGETLIVLHVSHGNNGELTATIDSPHEHITGVTVDTITFKEPDLHFGIAAFNRGFDGRINHDHSRIAGMWKQPDGSLLLVFHRVADRGNGQ